jgi:SnoaL-like polyketide cyclase
MDLSALKDFTDSFFTGMPDLQHPLDELITEGDKVALRGRYAGTHTGGATAKRAAAAITPPPRSSYVLLSRERRERMCAAPARRFRAVPCAVLHISAKGSR